jgi:hypothetical protein
MVHDMMNIKLKAISASHPTDRKALGIPDGTEVLHPSTMLTVLGKLVHKR